MCGRRAASHLGQREQKMNPMRQKPATGRVLVHHTVLLSQRMITTRDGAGAN